MPKGVEHSSRDGLTDITGQRVREPLMPKGVEHIIHAAILHRVDVGERTIDAERR